MPSWPPSDSVTSNLAPPLGEVARAKRGTEGVSSPDDPALADDAADLKSAYLHIPFCARRCPYCDFAVVTPSERTSPVARYVTALESEIVMEDPWGPLDAVNLGGGTPSTLQQHQLAALLKALASHHTVATGAEISLEANPEDWTDEYAVQLVAAGFTRVSFGIQSFDPAVLASLGRQHTPEHAAVVVDVARRAGVASVSLDLMYGAPGESEDSWRQTVERALDLGPDHLSGYALTVEPGTELSRMVLAGGSAPDPDIQADRFYVLAAAAAEAGLIRYEVSNWAKPGHHCRYNLATWAGAEFVGFGLGAHDHRDIRRSRNHRRLDRYLESIERGERPRLGSEALDPWGREQERVMLGLRRVAGVVTGGAGTALLSSAEGGRLVAAGVLERDGDRIRVLDPMLTDAAARAVLSVSEGDC